MNGSDLIWNIVNHCNTSRSICNVTLSWPGVSGDLKGLVLDGRDQIHHSVSWPGQPVTIVGCNCSDPCRSIEPGRATILKASFDEAASSSQQSQYKLRAVLCDDCSQMDRCACDFITGYNLSFGRDSIEWNITNLDTHRHTICSIELFWPSNNGELKRVALDNSDIYTIAIPWSNETVILPSKDCDILNRTILQGQTRALKIYFGENISGSNQLDYRIGINFCENCSLNFKPADRICNISTGNLTLHDDNKSARLRIANWGNGPVTICRIQMTTTEKHPHLMSVMLDEEEIFKGDKAPPEMIIPEQGDHWNGTDGRRSIGQGQTKMLQLNFGGGAGCCHDPLNIESLQVDLCPCTVHEKPEKGCGKPGAKCKYEIPQPIESSECWMAGPGSICETSVGVYIPIVDNTPAPDRYSYTWRIDNGGGTSGDTFSLDGCSLCIGKHIVQLTVNDGGQSICKSHKVVRIAPVPTFTIFEV